VAGRRFGLDLSVLRPKGYQAVPHAADLVVTVCDRASESEPPVAGTRMHWSIPDPVGKDPDAFDAAFADIATRIRRLGE
jgi:ArsR family transcriptional regulator, arsenate/arsenite/antimonite-responsive transcriptional repressor / arsenate reductase (thioredoxin)